MHTDTKVHTFPHKTHSNEVMITTTIIIIIKRSIKGEKSQTKPYEEKKPPKMSEFVLCFLSTAGPEPALCIPNATLFEKTSFSFVSYHQLEIASGLGWELVSLSPLSTRLPSDLDPCGPYAYRPRTPARSCCVCKADKPYSNHDNMIKMVKLLPEDVIILDSQIVVN